MILHVEKKLTFLLSGEILSTRGKKLAYTTNELQLVVSRTTLIDNRQELCNS